MAASALTPTGGNPKDLGNAGFLRQRLGPGTDVTRNLLRAEELKKPNKFRAAVKRWFVLYDDNYHSLGGGCGPADQMPVIGGAAVQNHHHHVHHRVVHDEPHVPAHLEYHDSEKKWREGRVPNKDVVLRECFNIFRKLDRDIGLSSGGGAGAGGAGNTGGGGAGGPGSSSSSSASSSLSSSSSGVGTAGSSSGSSHSSASSSTSWVIAVCTLKETLDIIFDKEQDMLCWLDLLLSCQQGGRSAQGRIARPIYEHMWDVNVKGFKPEKGSSASKFFQMAGPHRLVVSHDAIKFFELGSDDAKTFPIKDIKGHGDGKSRYYKILTGRLTLSGRGEIEVDCRDQTVAGNIYSTVI